MRVKVARDKAIAMVKDLIKKGESLSASIRSQLEYDKKFKIKRSYDRDLKLLDVIVSNVKTINSALEKKQPGFSFSGGYETELNSTSSEILAETFYDLAENDSLLGKDLMNDRQRLHQKVLGIQKKENISYREALNITVHGRK